MRGIDDIDAFAEACEEIVYDRKKNIILGKQARGRAESLFNEHIAINKYLNLYEYLRTA